MDLKATRYVITDGIAVVTLARPKRRNAWTGRMHTEYRWILREADRDPGVRVMLSAARDWFGPLAFTFDTVGTVVRSVGKAVRKPLEPVAVAVRL